MTPASEHYLTNFTFFFVSLRLLGRLAFRIFHYENESTASPSSPTPETEGRRFLSPVDSKGVGLGIVGALVDDNSVDSEQNPESPRILFGFQINTDSPPLLFLSDSPVTSSDSETEVTTESRVGTWNPPRIIQICLSASEMEMSEEYTRVIFHGPKPRIMHIYSNCIVDNSLFEAESSSVSSPADDQSVYPSSRFLSFCDFCKKRMGRQDIYMLRDERAFCSAQCRYAGILMTEEEEFLKVAPVKKAELLSVAAV
ncbi:FCS-Like Zinc finger 8 [Neltuma alba]|uniref:FCS-Like Zinc finger 8 n=1 Tax=Neltuma alba TaxID=207710 RepID=UPI0010A35CFE|nr:FCS-Like Zinc finger 8 [Prosopis alba]